MQHVCRALGGEAGDVTVVSGPAGLEVAVEGPGFGGRRSCLPRVPGRELRT